MLKHLVVLLVLSTAIFADAQACYKIPTKAENSELQKLMLALIDASSNSSTDHELIHWYLALQDLLSREIIADGVVQNLITCCTNGGIEFSKAFMKWPEAASYTIHRAKKKQPAYERIQALEKKLPEALLRKCALAQMIIDKRIKEDLSNLLEKVYVQEWIEHDLNDIAIVLAQVFKKFRYVIEYDKLGITVQDVRKF